MFLAHCVKQRLGVTCLAAYALNTDTTGLQVLKTKVLESDTRKQTVMK